MPRSLPTACVNGSSTRAPPPPRPSSKGEIAGRAQTVERLTWGFATVALVLVLGWLLYAQATSREAARVQRANTEELLSYMLGDLQRLDPIAGVENTVIEHPEYAERMQALGLADWNSEDLFEKALASREAGMELNWEGRLEEAMEQFQDSHATLIELHRREGNFALQQRRIAVWV